MKMVVDPYVLSVPKDEVLDKDLVIEFLIRLRSWDFEFIGDSNNTRSQDFRWLKCMNLELAQLQIIYHPC